MNDRDDVRPLAELPTDPLGNPIAPSWFCPYTKGRAYIGDRDDPDPHHRHSLILEADRELYETARRYKAKGLWSYAR
jgi:hypothetical protein